jgi:hypothetical protein
METMPTDACRYFYECIGCGTKLQPKSGDCCVFAPMGPYAVRRCRSNTLSVAAQGEHMPYDTAEPSRDWLANTSSSLLAWWIPQAAMLGGLFVSTPVRVIVWTLALVWMGAACILNSRRCGRTHCRYTRPYYLIMIVPVLVFGLASLGI